MKNKITLLCLLAFAVFLSGCENDNPVTPNNPVVKGAYILSEGGFSAGTSKLSAYDAASGTFTENILTSNLTLFADGLAADGNDLYLAAQGNFGSTGKLYKADTSGNVTSSVDAGVNPYSIAVSNNKVFVTNGPSSSVSVFNKNDLSPVTTINVGIYPQEILSVGNKVFVCNTGTFGGSDDSTISVIDASSNTVTSVITVRKNPSGLAVSNDGYLLAGCPGDLNSGMIYKIDMTTYNKVDSFSTPEGFDKDISVDAGSSDIYYVSGNNNIYKYNISTKTGSVFITNSDPTNIFFYGYAYDRANGKHYVLDAKNFTVAGSMYVYNTSASLVSTFTTGIAPRRVIVK